MRKRDKGQLISGSNGYEGGNRVRRSPKVHRQHRIVFTCRENHYTIHLAAMPLRVPPPPVTNGKAISVTSCSGYMFVLIYLAHLASQLTSV